MKREFRGASNVFRSNYVLLFVLVFFVCVYLVHHESGSKTERCEMPVSVTGLFVLTLKVHIMLYNAVVNVVNLFLVFLTMALFFSPHQLLIIDV